MSDFDPVVGDLYNTSCICCTPPTVDCTDVPQIVANELRRIYESHGDPSLYFLVIRAQEIETL